jgi:hypothetical protein
MLHLPPNSAIYRVALIVAIRINGETKDAKIVNIFPSKILCITNVTITWETTQIIFLQNYN